jgi:hypothetical protein
MISKAARALLDIVEEHGMDPLMIFAAVIPRENLVSETLFGMDVFRYLEVLFTLHGYSIDDAVASFKPIFHRTAFDGFRGILKTRGLSASGTKIFSMKMSSSRKNDMMIDYMKQCKIVGFTASCASIVQLVQMRDQKEVDGGAFRVHKIFTHAQDCVLSCRDLLRADDSILSIVEIPNVLQLVQKIYIDWDFKENQLEYLNDIQDCDARLLAARNLAAETPALICSILILLGIILPEDVVEIVVKEGTRWIPEKKAYKISMHFVFQLLGTRSQVHDVWDRVLQYIGETSPVLDSVLKGDVSCITSTIAQAIGTWLPLVGIDLHPISNAEQGLAMAFSRKTSSDMPSRLMRILHVKGGVEYMNEIPCNSLWNARMKITTRPLHIRYDTFAFSLCCP